MPAKRIRAVIRRGFGAAEAMRHPKSGGWNARMVGLQTATVMIDERGVADHTQDVGAAGDQAGLDGGVTVVDLQRRGPAYTVIQHEAHTDLLNTLFDESGAHFETAGSLRGGRAVFLLMKLSTHPRHGLAHLTLAVMAAGLPPAALNDLTH